MGLSVYPEELASAAIFLASDLDKEAMDTGIDLQVDGGSRSQERGGAPVSRKRSGPSLNGRPRVSQAAPR